MQHLIYDVELGHHPTKCCIFPQCKTRLAFAIKSSAWSSYSLEDFSEFITDLCRLMNFDLVSPWQSYPHFHCVILWLFIHSLYQKKVSEVCRACDIDHQHRPLERVQLLGSTVWILSSLKPGILDFAVSLYLAACTPRVFPKIPTSGSCMESGVSCRHVIWGILVHLKCVKGSMSSLGLDSVVLGFDQCHFTCKWIEVFQRSSCLLLLFKFC